MRATGKKPHRLNHYVPRFYLRAWAEKEKLYCLQRGEIRQTSVNKVGTENYFYRLQELTSDGVDLLRAIIKESPEGLRSFHERLLRAFTAPYLIKRRLEASGRATSEAMAEIDRTIIELNENVHTSIEEGFRPHLVAMISGKLDFLENPEKAAVFYRGLAAQYTRTNLIKQKRHARGYKVNCVNGHRKDHTGETRWLSTSNSSTSCWQTTRSQKTL